MNCNYGRRDPSMFDSFTLSPLPYPVLLILLLVLLLLGMSWSFAYEDIVEEAEETINWLLLASPIVLLLLIRWLSSFDSFDGLLRWAGWFCCPCYDRRQQGNYYGQQPSSSSTEGGSPWGVAAVMVLVLVMVFLQSLA